jgi:glucose/arabinose dehydrogenase
MNFSVRSKNLFRLSALSLLAFPSLSYAQTGTTPKSATPKSGERGPGVPEFAVRPGYRVTVAAEGLTETRFMEFDDKGNLYLSQPRRGTILTLRLKDGKYQPVADFVSEYDTVHGMHWKNGWLWFTQSGAIHRGRDTNGDGKADEIKTVVPDGQLPKGGGHWWRSIVVGENHFWTSIGDAGNINDETATERQKVWRFNLDGTGKTLWSSGIRNTEKLRLRPGTQEVWGADHGSDNFGVPLKDGKRNPNSRYDPITDTYPPCEFNHYEEGQFYGHPFVVGHRIPRYEDKILNREDLLELVAKTVPPAWSFGAHWAPNGWTFLTKDYFPDHKGDAFVALHGSWNSSVPVGYRVERILFDKVTGVPYGAQPIVSCLSDDNRVLDRPVDCVEAPDGSILFGSSSSNRIYRISRIGAPAGTKPATRP